MATFRLLLLSALVIVASAAEPPRTGTFTTSFAERSPESAYERMARRMGWGKSDPDAAYDLPREVFEVHVPAAYDPARPWGLVVFINSGKGGNARYYAEIMASRNLIWVASADSPNERHFPIRMALALDAAWNMAQRYRIDPRRTYLSGLSGGGRCASELAPVYPDVFSGAFYFCGCNPPNWPAEKNVGIPVKRLAAASRFALMTGTNDPNRGQTRSLADAYLAMGLPHSSYIEEPGLGHAMPTPPWFAKAVDILDQPLQAEAEALLAKAKAAAGRPLEAWSVYGGISRSYPTATEAVKAAEEARALLTDAAEAAARAAWKTATGGNRLRALAAQAEGLPCAADIRAAAAEAGAQELGRLGQKPEAKQLRAFAAVWSGYPCGDEAAARCAGKTTPSIR